MLTRNCFKVTGFARFVLDKKISSKISNVGPINKCICVQAHRLISRSARPETRLRYRDVTSASKGVHKDANFKTLTQDELLEKLMTSLSTDFYQKNRVYKNDLLRVINKLNEINFSSKKQGLFLLRCCTELLPDESACGRMVLAEQVWNALKPHTKFDVDHYNELLKVYIANSRTLTAASFIQKMSPVEPNSTTYELLLRVLGEAGDVNQATEVIANMKSRGYPATESIFNSLIVCQGKAGNHNNVQDVLTMMKSLKLKPTVDTYVQLARVHIVNKKEEMVVLEELKKAEAAGLKFGENSIMEIVKTAALAKNYAIIPKVLKFLPQKTLDAPSISPLMQSVSTQLVFLNNPIAALEIYKCLPLPSFGPRDDTGLHGRSLVRDCVKASMPINVIGLVTQELMASGRNVIALQCATEAALQLGKVPLALDLFHRMKQLGMPLRSHYFWPILLQNAASYGEKGIMKTLQTMVTMDVPLDYETIADYVMPYVSFTSPQTLMKKFTETGLTVTMVLTAVMETLLNLTQVRAASEIGEIFQGKIDAERLMKPLLKAYLSTLDTLSTVHILEDMTTKAIHKDKDWVGRFLCEHIQHKKVTEDITDFCNIIKELKVRGMKISTSAADFCITRLPSRLDADAKSNIKAALIEITDDRIADEIEVTSYTPVHPKQMDEPALKAHLNELEAKGMNTRGVLRKLLQKYCSVGNLNAANEIVDKCVKEGVFLSAGMKASIFDLQIKKGELELAELSLADLNKTAPNFTLDEFKVIDFATLMVYRGQVQKAMDMIDQQSQKRRVVGGRNIEMNCWRLLDATAANGNYSDTRKLFDLLLTYGYCKASNTLLGPLIRVHLKQNNVPEAVQEFKELAGKFKKTPLKHELLCKILSLMNDGHTEENFLNNEKANGKLNKLLQTVLNVDKQVHGPGDVPLTLIVALAEVGYKKTLRKLFLDPTVSFHPEALLRRCERFSFEKKIAALETIAECVKDRKNFKVEVLYELILNVYQCDDNTREALTLWNKMLDNEIPVSQKFVDNITSLLKANNIDVPAEINIVKMKTKEKQASTK